jgi:hypothetical protein
MIKVEWKGLKGKSVDFKFNVPRFTSIYLCPNNQVRVGFGPFLFDLKLASSLRIHVSVLRALIPQVKERRSLHETTHQTRMKNNN